MTVAPPVGLSLGVGFKEETPDIRSSPGGQIARADNEHRSPGAGIFKTTILSLQTCFRGDRNLLQLPRSQFPIMNASAGNICNSGDNSRQLVVRRLSISLWQRLKSFFTFNGAKWFWRGSIINPFNECDTLRAATIFEPLAANTFLILDPVRLNTGHWVQLRLHPGEPVYCQVTIQRGIGNIRRRSDLTNT
ncbi:hypothetical protein B0H19DRAFT_1086285 [Mycena capillaripes]|nr:hypothetical protein B0H19DRAFT_1086285 [Mycena capillaripes]